MAAFTFVDEGWVEVERGVEVEVRVGGARGEAVREEMGGHDEEHQEREEERADAQGDRGRRRIRELGGAAEGQRSAASTAIPKREKKGGHREENEK
jgi:hypothetical protein